MKSKTEQQGDLEQAALIFERARELEGDARRAYLDEACHTNTSLRADILSMLEAEAGQGRFLSDPTLSASRPLTEGPGTTIDRYKLLQRIGEGGFGVVYMAEQQKPVRRRVALKIIKLGMDTKQVIARFEAERQALAMMDHPNIAKVLDAGATDTGRPYFVMELVKGMPITQYCDKQRMSLRDRLKLFVQVCGAVQHAHQKGIIHRDIKPSNVLVTHVDDRPVTKVIDFGIAKATEHRLTEQTMFTELGQFIGTPAYMSPEQADPIGGDIDTRSDIYSLGVLLYELLTGVTPFDIKTLRAAALDEIKRIIREDEPSKPSTRVSNLDEELDTVARQRASEPRKLGNLLRGDLDWIIMKALEKDRTRRYETANGFGKDIERYLSDEPVTAGPPSAVYRMRKFVRRNRMAVIAASTVLVLLLAGIAGTSVGLIRARAAQLEQSRARKEAELARAEVQKRADELKTVTEFQQSMLSDLDAETMGQGIYTNIREGIREGLESGGADPAQVEAALASFDGLVARVNATNLALNVVDENVLARAVETIHKDFAEQPLVRAALQQTVADTYREIGLYEPAMPLQEASLRTRRRELGDEHPSTLTSINNMGFLLTSMGKNEQAEPYYREALEGKRRVLGDDHPSTLISINNMGGLLEWMGKYEEAEPYYREALDGKRRVLGNDHPDTLLSIGNMGYLLKSMGKLLEAEPFYREDLEATRRVLGDDHPATLISINNMGSLLEAMGKLAEAEPFYRKALEGSRRVLGDDHPSTLRAINNMGVLLQGMGKSEEALPFVREALESQRRVLGDDHPGTLRAINNMGFILQAMGKLTEAEALCREALRGSRRVLGDDHPGTLRAINNMGHLMREMGRLTEAETLGAEAVRRGREALGEGHWHFGVFLGAYGKTLLQLERFADAEAALLESHSILEAALGAQHDRTIKIVNTLIDLYDARHDAEPGKGYDRKAAEWREPLSKSKEPAEKEP